MNYTEYVNLMGDAILEASRVAAKDRITHMSTANLRQCTHFPIGAANANMAARAFEEALNRRGHCLHVKIKG